MTAIKLSILPACALASALLFGCKPALPPSKPQAELTAQEQSGEAVFQSRCGGCHYPNSQKGLDGPGLQGLYKRKYLPSGAPANDDRVTSTIIHGRGMMPAIGPDLDEQQLQDLLVYLHTL